MDGVPDDSWDGILNETTSTADKAAAGESVFRTEYGET